MTNFVRILYAIRSRFLTEVYFSRKGREKDEDERLLLAINGKRFERRRRKTARNNNRENRISRNFRPLSSAIFPPTQEEGKGGGGVSSPQNIQQRRTSIAQLGNSIQPSCIAALRHEAATLPLTDYDRGTILCSRPGNCCVHPR